MAAGGGHRRCKMSLEFRSNAPVYSLKLVAYCSRCHSDGKHCELGKTHAHQRKIVGLVALGTTLGCGQFGFFREPGPGFRPETNGGRWVPEKVAGSKGCVPFLLSMTMTCAALGILGVRCFIGPFSNRNFARGAALHLKISGLSHDISPKRIDSLRSSARFIEDTSMFSKPRGHQISGGICPDRHESSYLLCDSSHELLALLATQQLRGTDCFPPASDSWILVSVILTLSLARLSDTGTHKSFHALMWGSSDFI